MERKGSLMKPSKILLFAVVAAMFAGVALRAETPPVPEAFTTIENLLEAKEYRKALEVVEKELAATPDDFRLIAIKSFIQFKHLDQADAAFATVDNAIADYPKLYDLYDFKIELIRRLNPPDADERVFAVYREIAGNFSDKPLELSNLGLLQLQRPLGEGRLPAAMLLLMTARENMLFAPEPARYMIMTNLARGYYFSSRADLALREQTAAAEYAANELDKLNGEKLIKFYKEADAMAKELK